MNDDVITDFKKVKIDDCFIMIKHQQDFQVMVTSTGTL